jgi:hypothetical protein
MPNMMMMMVVVRLEAFDLQNLIHFVVDLRQIIIPDRKLCSFHINNSVYISTLMHMHRGSCFFQPYAPLLKVVEDLGKVGKGLTKQDHIV